MLLLLLLFFPQTPDILSVNNDFSSAGNYERELRSGKESEDLQLQSLQT